MHVSKKVTDSLIWIGLGFATTRIVALLAGMVWLEKAMGLALIVLGIVLAVLLTERRRPRGEQP